MSAQHPGLKELKILHLATDEKFVDQAYESFERVAQGANQVFVCGEEPLKYVKLNPSLIVHRYSAGSDWLVRRLAEFDFVIIHSLTDAWIRLVNKAPSSTIFVWIGWGFDYYDLIFLSEQDALLPETNKARDRYVRKKSIISSVRSLLSGWFYGNKVAALSRIRYFAPVLEEEFELVMNRVSLDRKPEFISWNYGNLEDNLIKGFENSKISGTNILVGNSASSTNNHIDVFDSLKNASSAGRSIIVPLSYGDLRYRDVVVEAGHQRFGDGFKPLIDFMPIEDYLSVIKSCGFVIMNHVRQQALGNIVIMLYLGAKVFLREENPVYRFLKRQGAHVYSIQELDAAPGMLDVGLDAVQQEVNREIVSRRWSREASDGRTRSLIERVARERQAENRGGH